jgi:hypothetical protein
VPPGVSVVGEVAQRYSHTAAGERSRRAWAWTQLSVCMDEPGRGQAQLAAAQAWLSAVEGGWEGWP